MTQRPKLVPSRETRDHPFCYRCSICNQGFLPPEDRSPKEAMAEVWAAFTEHIQDEHMEEMNNQGACPA